MKRISRYNNSNENNDLSLTNSIYLFLGLNPLKPKFFFARFLAELINFT